MDRQVRTGIADLARANEHRGASGKALEERLQFERLLLDLSARFVNIPSDQVDTEIQSELKKIVEFFRVDRCVLLQHSKEKVSWQITHAAFADGLPPMPVGVDLRASLYPWIYSRLVEGHEVLTFATLEDLPAEASADKQSLRKWGIRSAVFIPLVVGGPLDYHMAVTADRQERGWPKEFVLRLHLLGEILATRLERRQSRQQMEERIKFEALLAEISSHFVNLPADEVDSEIDDAEHRICERHLPHLHQLKQSTGEIEDALRRICELFGFDRSTFLEVPAGGTGDTPLATFQKHPGGPPVPRRMMVRVFFPWVTQKILCGETLAISNIEDLPPEAALDRESYRLYGVRSTLVIPLFTGAGLVFGALSFGVLREKRDWPEAIVKRLQLIAQVFANAIAGRQAEKALRESETRLSLATNAAEVGLWILELDTGKVWVSAKTRELFCFGPEEDLNYESVFKVIHPEDRERVKQVIQEALQSGENLLTDYRIVLPDGSIRWIAARGRRYPKSAGEPYRLMGVSLDITERKQMENQLKENLREIEELKQRLEEENIFLKEDFKLQVEHNEIVGQGLAMKKVLDRAEKVARTDSTVLIQGETGTGKELLARAIHNMSSRKERPLVTVNCASLPPTLIESELFGREKGAYTGALTKMIGRFELADGSTLFLDEIGELPIELQSKLLRIIEEGSFERLGSTKPLHVNVRIIAATNRDLEHEVKGGTFRKDLFYRLNVFPVVIPPLREHPEDIPPMVWLFVREFQKRMGKEVERISKKTMEALQSYPWPGNVRELKNVIEHAMILSRGKSLVVHMPNPGSSEPDATRNLEDMERSHIVAVLERAGWRVAGKGGAAEILGLKRSTLYSKMKKLGIYRPAS